MTQSTATDANAGAGAKPDFVLFVVSSYSVSRRRIEQLRATVCDHAGTEADLIRLDTNGPDLLTALDDRVAQGYRAIRVQPLGLPLSDSLLNWLPGVLAHWRESRSASVQILLGSDQAAQQAGWGEFLGAMLDEPATPIEEDTEPSLGKPGWTNVPDFRYHLLVCTGPRCQIHGSNPLLQQLQANCRSQGVYKDCLITRAGCMFPCNQGPLVAVYPQGGWYRLADTQAVEDFVREVLVAGEECTRLRVHQTETPTPNSKPDYRESTIESIDIN
ncbi:(2Fe-2S) ferredoxin domain-containing protein [Natronospirillum operosum]|uniref:(2Fe-2S) ferredoxin domain-containing protein n=1 Tax=Natronospirillum operosum TaxID=2759953 RepID=A0A4Z0WGS8_9GAMM|nr:(2Fe-2S) ferredoxin domain-containing protein [Natronospirillum operosum]TGG93850.1 (2Fe-2S) ferredoxin domain-containing protein [Natronospirillum operosum]